MIYRALKTTRKEILSTRSCFCHKSTYARPISSCYIKQNATRALLQMLRLFVDSCAPSRSILTLYLIYFPCPRRFANKSRECTYSISTAASTQRRGLSPGTPLMSSSEKEYWKTSISSPSRAPPPPPPPPTTLSVRNDARPKNEAGAEAGVGAAEEEEEGEARHRNRVAFAAVTLPVETLAKNEMSSPSKASLGHPGLGGGRLNLTAANGRKGTSRYFTIKMIL